MRNQRDQDHTSFDEVHEDLESTPAEDIEGIIEEMRGTLEKLVKDQASRADVKLLRTALKELRYAFKVFAPFQKTRKVTVFGSARLPADNPAYIQAVEFGKRLAEEGFLVITGAAAGIMEAGHVGAGREMSVGINILLPFEQEANPIIRDDHKLMHLKYFFTRKLLFVKEADAIALFPGGFGTQDECFEALTLVQTGKSHLFPIVMVDEKGGDYWEHWDRYIRKSLLARKLISDPDLALYKVTDSVDEAVEEILNFYSNYHSMRYIGRDLVLRFHHKLSDAALESIRTTFDDLVVSGTFEQVDAQPEEANEEHIQSLPRLRFHFDRHALGRLRMLIDFINQVNKE